MYMLGRILAINISEYLSHSESSKEVVDHMHDQTYFFRLSAVEHFGVNKRNDFFIWTFFSVGSIKSPRTILVRDYIFQRLFQASYPSMTVMRLCNEPVSLSDKMVTVMVIFQADYEAPISLCKDVDSDATSQTYMYSKFNSSVRIMESKRKL
jgi:hypothetical protein